MNWQTYLEERQVDFTARLLEFLRIPSISSLPEHSADVRAAGEWVAAQLRSAGMEHVEVMETGGHPVVYADWLHAPGKPTVLIYGHFDVQPADPLSLWESPPFEPVIQEGRVYARGASDDKGNMLAPLLALEALLAAEGALPVNVKCFWEGQEEIGSPTLPAFVAAHRDRFACDFVLSADGGQWGEEQPELLVGLRGLCALQVDVVGPAYDVHSGLYGGALQNPIHALAALLASLRDAEGRVRVEGFYDDVLELSAAERAEIARIPYDEAGVRQNLGVDTFFGEAGYSVLERSWVRPTLEVNGIWGGFQGEGVKTVLPSAAHAKITCRLVANQKPQRIVQQVKAHLERHAPPGVRVTVTVKENGAIPYWMPGEHPGNQAARAILVEEYGKEPYLARSGGSIPVTAMFLESLGAYTVSFGFGLDDERQHSPNEFFRLSNFVRGQRAYCKLLHGLAG